MNEQTARKKLRQIVLDLREERGLSQRELGEKLGGLSPGAIQGWERINATTMPDFESQAAIAKMRSQTHEELIAELYGRDYVPLGDKTWEELGKSMTDRQYEELHEGMELADLSRRAQILLKLLTAIAERAEAADQEH